MKKVVLGCLIIVIIMCVYYENQHPLRDKGYQSPEIVIANLATIGNNVVTTEGILSKEDLQSLKLITVDDPMLKVTYEVLSTIVETANEHSTISFEADPIVLYDTDDHAWGYYMLSHSDWRSCRSEEHISRYG